MLDKEKLELLNLRKKVEAQREEIKKLSEQLERHKDYIHALEELIETDDRLKDRYDLLKMLA